MSVDFFSYLSQKNYASDEQTRLYSSQNQCVNNINNKGKKEIVMLEE